MADRISVTFRPGRGVPGHLQEPVLSGRVPVQGAEVGWGSRIVGQGYGRGHSLQVLWRALLLID